VRLSTLVTALKLMKHRGGLVLMRDLRTQVRLNFLFAGMETGLLPALRTPHSRDELVTLLAAKREDLLDALLDVGVSTGELSLRDTTYRVAGRRSKAMLEAHGDMFVAIVEAYATYYNSLYRELPERLRGGPLGNQLELIGDLVARASQVSDPFLHHFVKRAAGSGARRMLEIGCGSGAHLRIAALANPALSGLGLDIDPAVVNQARRSLEIWGLSERFEVVEGDVRNHLELGLFDLITMYNVIYYFRPEERGPLLASLRQRLRPGGALAIGTSAQSKGRDAMTANLDLATRSLAGCAALPDLAELETSLRCNGFSTIEKTRLIPGGEYWGIWAST